MATVTVSVEDVAALAGADADAVVIDALIRRTMARMPRWAPCITQELTDATAAAIEGVVVDAIVRRYHQVHAGGVVRRSEGHGPFSVSEELARESGLFRPDEISELQDLCRGSAAAGAAPLGSFPEPEDYDQFFAKPSDYTWCPW